MTCPACGLENPASAERCDCGHEFVLRLGSKPRPPLESEVSPATPKIVGGLMLGIMLFGVIMFFRGSGDDQVASRPPEVEPKPESKLRLISPTWRKGGFGSVMLAVITVKNENKFAVKDIAIRCDMLGSSGTAIQAIKQTIYDKVLPGETKTFPELNMGAVHSQASNAKCEITDAARMYGTDVQ